MHAQISLPREIEASISLHEASLDHGARLHLLTQVAAYPVRQAAKFTAGERADTALARIRTSGGLARPVLWSRNQVWNEEH
jgi:hypothetical protein